MPKQHNYITKMLEILDQGVMSIAEVGKADVFHDDWCGIFKGGRCNCDPHLSYTTLWPGKAVVVEGVDQDGC